MSTPEVLGYIAQEIDEVKRYVANVYANTDNEVAETLSAVRKIDSQLRETDRQIDKIENFERTLNDIKSSLKAIEKKIR